MAETKPEPRGIQYRRRDGEWVTTKNKLVTFDCPTELAADFYDAAKALGYMSTAEALRTMMRKFVDERKTAAAQ